MKRLIVTVTGTVAGIAALLSFKNETQPVANPQPLPSAALSQGTVAPAPASPAASTAAAPKTVVGASVTTRYGIVAVKVTIDGHRIAKASFAELTAFDQHSQEINSWAGPELLTETLTAQSADIHTVSGASYTSDGYRQSLQSALDRAGF